MPYIYARGCAITFVAFGAWTICRPLLICFSINERYIRKFWGTPAQELLWHSRGLGPASRARRLCAYAMHRFM